MAHARSLSCDTMDGPSCRLFFLGVRSYSNLTRRTKSDHPEGSPSHGHLKKLLSLSFSIGDQEKLGRHTAQPTRWRSGRPTLRHEVRSPQRLARKPDFSKSSGSSSATNVGRKLGSPAKSHTLASRIPKLHCSITTEASDSFSVCDTDPQLSKTDQRLQEPVACEVKPMA